MVLHAAFDASKEMPVGTTAVAGYIADENKWRAIEERWNGQLVLAGITDFHLSAIRNRFPNWVEVVRPFAQLVHEVGLRSLMARWIAGAAEANLNRRAECVFAAWSKSIPTKERLRLEAMATPEQKAHLTLKRARRRAKPLARGSET